MITFIECGRRLDQARSSMAMWQALEADPSLDQLKFMEKWLDQQPACDSN